MIPHFNKPAGFDCIVTVGDSAEEGGYVLIDPAQDGKSLTLFMQSPITAENDKPGKAKGYNLTLGVEDRTFALTRIDSKANESFEAVTDKSSCFPIWLNEPQRGPLLLPIERQTRVCHQVVGRESGGLLPR
jgi:hypothetical protein